MPKTTSEVRALARRHTRTAIEVLVGIMRNEDATPAARRAAAATLLDRGWGKAPPPVAGGEGGPEEPIYRIERVIVHPRIPTAEIPK
ncbi:hypothetical protein [Bradyrhizobium sp.]|uniref:hypothetical protein n=1 Tax=Bradyrhizobium sp. TaxID=376 RepID=UPI003C135ADE